jgi:hypothetical protein
VVLSQPDLTRLDAAPDFREWTVIFHECGGEAQNHVEQLRPFVDGLYDGPYPGTVHTFLRLKRKLIVLEDAVGVMSRLLPWERFIRTLAEREG